MKRKESIESNIQQEGTSLELAVAGLCAKDKITGLFRKLHYLSPRDSKDYCAESSIYRHK